MKNHCPECHAAIGKEHVNCCKLEKCSACGEQRVTCGCFAHNPALAAWSGEKPTKRRIVYQRCEAMAEQFRCFAIESPIDVPYSEINERIDQLADSNGVGWSDISLLSSEQDLRLPIIKYC